MTPEEYRNEMMTGKVGRLDLDGICPYTGENEDGTLKRPTVEQLDEVFEKKAKKMAWSQDQKMPKDMLIHVVLTLEIYEKMMEYLVLAGFKPDQLQFLVPMSKMDGTSEEKNEMRVKISDFVSRLLKGAYRNAENYTYFRTGNHGFPNCIEIPAFSVCLAFRENERAMELLIAAQQCNAVLPPVFIGRIAYAIQFAEQEAQRGHLTWTDKMTPNLDPEVTQAVFRTIGDSESARRATAEAKAAAPSGLPRSEPKSFAPKPPPTKAAAPSRAAPSSPASSSTTEPKAKPPYKAMPTTPAPKPSRPSPSEKPQQAPQYKKKRTD